MATVQITTNSPKVVINPALNRVNVTLSVVQGLNAGTLGNLTLVADFIVGAGQPMTDGSTQFSSPLLTVMPFVFIDGVLQTTLVCSDRRYITHNATTKTITINGAVNEGENIRIVL
jgi:hypothetical protein